MPYVSENLAQNVKIKVISVLRDYFQNISQFGFPGNPIQMPIIREAYGLVIRQYPSIIVKILHEEPKNMGIGMDFVEDVMSDDQLVGQHALPGTEDFNKPVKYRSRVIAERYGYMSDITFNLQVWSDTTPSRNRVVDEVVSCFKHYMRKSLLKENIQLMRISMGEETDYPLDESQKIYVANINLVLNAVLYYDIDVDSVTAVNTYSMKPANLKPHQDPYIVQQDEINGTQT